MKKYFIVYMNAPRASFPQDITPDEGVIMQQHLAYCAKMIEDGKGVAFGPVLDPNGVYGMGIYAVDTDEELQSILANDPARALSNPENGSPAYEVYPFANFMSKNT